MDTRKLLEELENVIDSATKYHLQQENGRQR